MSIWYIWCNDSFLGQVTATGKVAAEMAAWANWPNSPSINATALPHI